MFIEKVKKITLDNLYPVFLKCHIFVYMRVCLYLYPGEVVAEEAANLSACQNPTGVRIFIFRDHLYTKSLKLRCIQ